MRSASRSAAALAASRRARAAAARAASASARDASLPFSSTRAPIGRRVAKANAERRSASDEALSVSETTKPISPPPAPEPPRVDPSRVSDERADAPETRDRDSADADSLDRRAAITVDAFRPSPTSIAERSRSPIPPLVDASNRRVRREPALATLAFSRLVAARGETTHAVASGPHVTRRTSRPASAATRFGKGWSRVSPCPSAPRLPEPHVYTPATSGTRSSPASATTTTAAWSSPLAMSVTEACFWNTPFLEFSPTVFANVTRAGASSTDPATSAPPTAPRMYSAPSTVEKSVCHVPQEMCATGARSEPRATRAGVRRVSPPLSGAAPPPELEPGSSLWTSRGSSSPRQTRPSLPPSASPHAYTSPSATAAVCHRPQDTDVTRFPASASTRVGVARAFSRNRNFVVVVSFSFCCVAIVSTPSAPNAFSPQVNSAPSAASAATWLRLAETSVTFRSPGNRIGAGVQREGAFGPAPKTLALPPSASPHEKHLPSPLTANVTEPPQHTRTSPSAPAPEALNPKPSPAASTATPRSFVGIALAACEPWPSLPPRPSPHVYTCRRSTTAATCDAPSATAVTSMPSVPATRRGVAKPTEGRTTASFKRSPSSSPKPPKPNAPNAPPPSIAATRPHTNASPGSAMTSRAADAREGPEGPEPLPPSLPPLELLNREAARLASIVLFTTL